MKKQATHLTQSICKSVFLFSSQFSLALLKKPFKYSHQSTSAQTTSQSTVSMWNKLERSIKWKPFTFLQGQTTWRVILHTLFLVKAWLSHPLQYLGWRKKPRFVYFFKCTS